MLDWSKGCSLLTPPLQVFSTTSCLSLIKSSFSDLIYHIMSPGPFLFTHTTHFDVSFCTKSLMTSFTTYVAFTSFKTLHPMATK